MRPQTEWTQDVMRFLSDLDLHFIDFSVFEAAFTHPSYKGINPAAEDYERLEFLGDAVFGLLAADSLFHHSIDSEGIMTERRKALVSNTALAKLFDVLSMSSLMRAAAQYQPTMNDKAHVVEAFMGAAFVDQGYAACFDLWAKILAQAGAVGPETAVATPQNAINALQELYQDQGVDLPVYEEIAREGPDHNPTYYFRVTAQPLHSAPDLIYSAIGTGNSKKAAKLAAAVKMCENLDLPYMPVD